MRCLPLQSFVSLSPPSHSFSSSIDAFSLSFSFLVCALPLLSTVMKSQPKIKPPYRSFTTAMSELRSPTYRSSHLERFHPYPRTTSRVRLDDQWMRTVDLRFAAEEEERVALPVFDLPTIPDVDSHHDTGTEALHTAIQSNAPLDKKGLKGIKLFSLILDLAFLVRRKCRRTDTKNSPSSCKTEALLA